MGVSAAQHFMKQATIHSTFPILVITKVFAYAIVKLKERLVLFLETQAFENVGENSPI